MCVRPVHKLVRPSFVVSHSISKITDEELRRGVVCRAVRWGKGKKNIFMPKKNCLKYFSKKYISSDSEISA